MNIIMILYYLITIFTVSMLVWNLIREKKDIQKIILYLIVLMPLVLRIFRIR